MSISPGGRVYLTTGISLAAVAVATWTGMMAGAAVSGREWWTLGAVAASVTAAGLPAYEQIRKERMRAQAEQVAVDAAVAMRVTMNDALDPIVRQLGRVVTARSKHEREALQEAAVPMVLDSAAHLAGTGRVRACLFRFAPGTPAMLVPAQYSGRVDDPLDPITEGSPEGDLFFGMIRRNEHLFYPDLDSAPAGWRPAPPQTYKSFAAVPVAAGRSAFGMLMVDALESNGIRRTDVPLIRLLAGLLADALA